MTAQSLLILLQLDETTLPSPKVGEPSLLKPPTLGVGGQMRKF
jgi:hypothetical protein